MGVRDISFSFDGKQFLSTSFDKSIKLIQISENAKKITDEYQRSHPDIPWSDINGLRNRIVHDYGNVDLNIVFETLKFDIPDLIRLISGEIDEPDIER